MVYLDQYRFVSELLVLFIAGATCLLSLRFLGQAAPAGAGVLRAGALRDHRHAGHDRVGRLHPAVHRAWRSCRSRSTCWRASTASGARRPRRRSSTSWWAPSPRVSCSTASRWCTAPPDRPTTSSSAQQLTTDTVAAGPHGPGAAAGRVRLQDRRGAVPHVGTRRLRRRAHAGHRLHGDGREDRRVRGAGTGADRGVPGLHRPLAADRRGARRRCRWSSATWWRWRRDR